MTILNNCGIVLETMRKGTDHPKSTTLEDTMSDVNHSIEHGQYKDNVREEIVGQIVKWATSLCKKTIRILTLPGQECLFEKKLVEACATAGIKVEGHCYESKKNIFEKMHNTLPAGLRAWNSDISLWKIDEEDEKMQFDVAWFDYCGEPLVQNRLEVFLEFVKLHNVALAYGTFRLQSRQQCASYLSYDICGHFHDDVAQAIREHIEKLELAHCHKILDIKYAGGGAGLSNMLTIGFQTGKVKIIKCLEDDWLLEHRQKVKGRQEAMLDRFHGMRPTTDASLEATRQFLDRQHDIIKPMLIKLKHCDQQIEALRRQIKTLENESTKHAADLKTASPIMAADNDEFIRLLFREEFTRREIYEACRYEASNEKRHWSWFEAIEKDSDTGKYIPSRKKIAAITNWM